MQHTQTSLGLGQGKEVLLVPLALALALGYRCASPGYLVWCRGLPLLQTVSQSLGADVSRLSVSVSPREALLPHVKMHEHSQVRASASNCM